MSHAFYVQKPSINISEDQITPNRTAPIASIRLGPGNWVIFAKFDVAVPAGAGDDLRPRNSTFELEFGGVTDKSFCNLNQGGLDTVVLNVAAPHGLTTILGGGPLFVTAHLFCSQANSDVEVLHLAMTAFSVELLN
jgi:hypothetical protein